MKIIPSDLLTHSGNVTAFFTTREQGVSPAPYDSLNLAFHVGDDPQNVLRNHDLLAQTMDYGRHRLIHMRQIHSDRIMTVDESVTFDTPPECDALITNRTEIPLMVMSADCTPILLYDPITYSVGAVHAGRAGALNMILPKTIRLMHETYGTDPKNLKISMGPSIHGCCYEINFEIARDVETKGYASSLRRENGRVFLDVNTILRIQLQQLGIMENEFEIIDACTSCQCDTFFSYRADAQQTGRIAGVIILRS